MAAAQGWRWFLASFLDAVNVERGGGGIALGFSLAGLFSPQANLFRAFGSEEPQVCILMAERKRIVAKELEAEEVQPVRRPWQLGWNLNGGEVGAPRVGMKMPHLPWQEHGGQRFVG